MTDFETMRADVARLTTTVADLMARVTHLEEALEGGTFAAPAIPSRRHAEFHSEFHAGPEPPAAPGPAPARHPGERSVEGTITYRGTVRAGMAALDHEVSHPVTTLLDLDEVELARTLGVIATPARLTVLRALLEGGRDAGQLRRAVGPAGGAELDRDLRALSGAGLIAQPAPGSFEAIPDRAIPLLAILAGAHDLTAPTGD
jgi:hypothetical protein